MTPAKTLPMPVIRTEDVLVNGLFTGLLAGLIMLIFLILASGSISIPPAEVMGMFDPAGSANMVAGAAAHLAVSGVYGLIFGLLWKLANRWRVKIPGWLAGILYGGLIFTAAELLIIPGSNSTLRQISPALFGIGNLIFGITLGLGLQLSLTNQKSEQKTID